MKKIFFLFALLASMTASATVTVTPLGVNYGTKTVTFSVSWTDAAVNNRVWVWVDFCSINGTSPGSFAPATVTSPAITGGNGTITNATARGFFIEYGATNAGTTVTATLNNAPADKFNWCVYGSDAPPNVTASGGIYTLHGVPPFTLTAAGGTATQTVAAKTIATSAVTIMPVTLTDQTGYPGVFCIYTGSDLFIDGTHLCQQRASGAQNWEAWIKDTRDNELYRVVLMPDTKWWLAQNVKYAKAGSTLSWCTPNECGRAYTTAEITASYDGGTSGGSGNKQGICPPGWVLPVCTDWQQFISSMGSVAAATTQARLRPTSLAGATDYYGWADIKQHCETGNSAYTCWYYQYATHNHSGLIIDGTYGLQTCFSPHNGTWSSEVRCWR